MTFSVVALVYWWGMGAYKNLILPSFAVNFSENKRQFS